jgi:hypothetical protein
MATYIQGVTDYIPDYQPFQPDLNFYGNVLQAKQSQYDTNYKAINNLYGELYNTALTHDDNIKKKDELLKQIDFNLKRVSGLDLSLEQNVNQATQVFKPFYEDQYLMKDMAWTKNYMNVINRASALQNSQDEKQRKQYWGVGIQALQHRREEFKEATLDETLNMNNVKYTPYDNAVQKYLDIAKEMDLSVDKTSIDPSGLYFVRQKNGELILPALQSMFISEYANNPQLQEIYATQAYVERKNYAAQNATKYGDKKAAEKQYLTEKYNWLQNLVSEQNKKAQDETQVTKNKSAQVEKDQKEGEVNVMQGNYIDRLNQALQINEAVSNHADKLDKDINDKNSTVVTSGGGDGLDLNNLELARLKVDAGYASYLAQQDIHAASGIYAYKDYVQDIKANPVGLEKLRHANASARLSQVHGNKIAEINYKNQLEKQKRWEDHGLKTGTLIYDENQNVIPNPSYVGATKEKDPNSTDAEVAIDELNFLTRLANDKANVDPFIKEFMVTMKKHIDNGENGTITDEEVWHVLNGSTSSARENVRKVTSSGGVQTETVTLMRSQFDTEEEFQAAYTKYKKTPGTYRPLADKSGKLVGFQHDTKKKMQGGKEQFLELYEEYKRDPEAVSQRLRSSNQIIDIADKFNNWAIKNKALNQEYLTSGTYNGVRSFEVNCFDYERVMDKNDAKIKATIANQLRKEGGYSDAQINAVADLYARWREGVVMTGAMDKGYLPNRKSEGVGETSFDVLRPQIEKLLQKDYRQFEFSPRAGKYVGMLAALTPSERAQFVSLGGRTSGDISGSSKEARNYLNSVFRGNPKADGYKEVMPDRVIESLNNAYLNLVTDPSKETGLASLIQVHSGPNGKAMLAADVTSELVNLAAPYTPGFKSFTGMYNDILAINWKQDASKYRITTAGSVKPADYDDKTDLVDKNEAQALLDAAMAEVKAGSTVQPFKILQSQIAMESADLGSMTVKFPREFLEKHVKTALTKAGVPTTDAATVQAKIDKYFQNGITFIAPKQNWNNNLFTGNKYTPVQSLLEAGPIEYKDPFNSGQFKIEKVNVPGYDYMVTYSLTSYNPDGTPRTEKGNIMNKHQKGNFIDDIQTAILQKIDYVSKINTEGFKNFHSTGDMKAVDNMKKGFGYEPSFNFFKK